MCQVGTLQEPDPKTMLAVDWSGRHHLCRTVTDKRQVEQAVCQLFTDRRAKCRVDPLFG